VTRNRYLIANSILVIIGLVLSFELIRDSLRNGDFAGYVRAGNLVLENKDIYSDALNTWPPFFAVFSVILALGDKVSGVFIRFLWLAGSILSMYLVIKLTIRVVLGQTVSWGKKKSGVIFQDNIILVPVLIMLRFLLENLANVQINIYMLLLACLAIFYFINNKNVLLGLVLALSISLKVYTVFMLFYFIYKRELKPVLWTIVFLLLFNSIAFSVFGFETAMAYYRHWYAEIASVPPTVQHKNQSIFGFMLRLLTSKNPGEGLFVNALNLKSETVKYITYGFILLASSFLAYLFRKKLTEKSSQKSVLEYSFVFSAIPLLSPLAWKAYFIFLWFPYLLTYVYLYKADNQLGKAKRTFLQSLFLCSIILATFSAQGIVGWHLSRILETVSCITIGTVLLLLIQLSIYRNMHLFELNAIQYQTAWISQRRT
jgi:hypothetical protein